MKWFLASDKLPEPDKIVPVKVYGAIGYVKYIENRTPKYFWYKTEDNGGTFVQAEYNRVKWLDIDAPSYWQARCEAAEAVIRNNPDEQHSMQSIKEFNKAFSQWQEITRQPPTS